MKYNFKRTFDAVSIDPEHKNKIRSALSSRISEKQKENSILNSKASFRRKPRAVVIAAITLTFLMLVGFSFGSQIIQMLSGGRIEIGPYHSLVEMIGEPNFVEVRDSRVYFIFDFSNTDITSYCSEETYYKYEYTDDNGYLHVVLIGGPINYLGWAEYVWDSNGKIIGGGATHYENDSAIWLKVGRAELGIDYSEFTYPTE